MEKITPPTSTVPDASALLVAAFTAAVSGFLEADTTRTKVTLHRLMFRNGTPYLQQLTDYAPVKHDGSHRNTGARTVSIKTGIISEALKTARIYRTKHFSSVEDHDAALQKEPHFRPDDPSRSFLAIPFLYSGTGRATLVLYAASENSNAFTDDSKLQCVVRMCDAFCKLLDEIAGSKGQLYGVQNFPYNEEIHDFDFDTSAYSIQEAADCLKPPTLKKLPYFNFEFMP